MMSSCGMYHVIDVLNGRVSHTTRVSHVSQRDKTGRGSDRGAAACKSPPVLTSTVLTSTVKTSIRISILLIFIQRTSRVQAQAN